MNWGGTCSVTLQNQLTQLVLEGGVHLAAA